MRNAITSLTILMGLSFGTIAVAQQPQTQRADQALASRLDTVTEGANIRASKMIGMNIQNSGSEALGEINDFVLDANSGRVKYVAVTYGGFLGIGNKMFAVPFAAFKVKPDPENRSNMILVLDVTQKQMEGAVGFDEQHWPNFADEKFQMELNRRYGVTRDGEGNLDVNVNSNGVNIDVQRDRK